MKSKQKAIYLMDDNEHPYSGWEFDNRGQSPEKKGVYASYSFEDVSTTYPTMLKRSFRPQSEGILTLESNFTIINATGFLYRMTDADKKNAFLLYTKDENFFLKQKNGDVKLGKVIEQKSSVKIVISFSEKTCHIYLNNTFFGKFDFAEDTTELCYLYIGIDEAGTGKADIAGVKLYSDYAVNERFLSPFSNTYPCDWTLATASKQNKIGTVFSQDNTFSKEDTYFLSVQNKIGITTFSKNFALQHGDICFETKFILPNISDNIRFDIKNADTVCFGVAVKGDTLFASSGEKICTCPNNLWNTLRFELDTERNSALIRLNGKEKGTFPVANASLIFDGIELSVTEKATVGIDYILVFPMEEEPDDYVPVPVPAKEKGYHVGLHVCSLWRYGFWRGTNAAWDICTAFDEITPYMGYYDEGIPEVADWETKWLCEHGVDFQLLCWYGPNHITEPIKFAGFSHALHDGYFNSKYKNFSKFAIMWENNFTKAITSQAFRDYLVPYFIEYYFKDPNYYCIDNKPVFSIYGFPQLYGADYFGSYKGAKAEMDYLKSEVKKAGFDDLILLFAGGASIDPNVAIAKEFVGAGGTYSYNWGTASYSSDYQKAMISSVGDSLKKNSEHLYHVPTVGVGFNCVARHDLRFPNIPLDEYEDILRWTKDEFLGSKTYFPDQTSWASKTLLLSCWNEYDEGHYINPSNLYGFGFLDRIREVFCEDTPHTDNKPTENQKSRLEIMAPKGRATLRPLRNFIAPLPPKNAKRTAVFSFADEDQQKLWEVTGTAGNGKFENGKLCAVSTGIDPSITYSWEMNYHTEEINFIHLRLKVNPNSSNKSARVNFYFKTMESNAFTGNKCLSATVKVGEFDDVYVSTSENTLWKGTLAGLRIDPMEQDGAFEIELVELIKHDLGNRIYIDSAPVVLDFSVDQKEGELLVPFNPKTGIFNKLNAYYEWRKAEKSILLQIDASTFLFTADSDIVLLNGKEIKLDCTPYLFDGIPMLPLKFICSHCLGYQFGFAADGKANVITPKNA